MQGKHLLRALGLLPLVLSMLVSCTGMVQDELDETHAKLAALQALVESVNNNLQGLDAIVAHLDDSHTIAPASLQEVEGGYKISFRDGREIFIAYGKDGQDGQDAVSPQLRINPTTLMWEISIDNGTTWQPTGTSAQGKDGKDGNEFFYSVNYEVTAEGEFMTVVTKSGQTFRIPIYKNA